MGFNGKVKKNMQEKIGTKSREREELRKKSKGSVRRQKYCNKQKNAFYQLIVGWRQWRKESLSLRICPVETSLKKLCHSNIFFFLKYSLRLKCKEGKQNRRKKVSQNCGKNCKTLNSLVWEYQKEKKRDSNRRSNNREFSEINDRNQTTDQGTQRTPSKINTSPCPQKVNM